MTEFVPFSLKDSPRKESSNAVIRAVPIARRLVSFDARPPAPMQPPPAEQAEAEMAETSVSSLISLTADEIDALKQAAYDAGHAKGAALAQSEARAAFSSTLTDLIRQGEDERAHHSGLAEKAGVIFADTLIDTIAALTRLPPAQLPGLHRDLVRDAIDLVLGLETEVKITCSARDEAQIKSALAQPEKVKFEPCADPEDSRIRIITGENTIVLDPQEWRRRAVDKVLTSVLSLSLPATASPKTISGP